MHSPRLYAIAIPPHNEAMIAELCGVKGLDPQEDGRVIAVQQFIRLAALRELVMLRKETRQPKGWDF